MPNVESEPRSTALKLAGVRPEARVLGALAVGPDRPDLPQGQGRRQPERVNDLFDPALQGQGHVLTEMRDSVGLVDCSGMGMDPEKATLDQDMTRRSTRSTKASKTARSARFTGNDYIKDIPNGDTWVCYGWSGDAVQLRPDNTNIEFLRPDEGFMLWTDNMQIPVGAPHAYTAEKFMNYVYEPEVQAPIEDYVNYMPPVKGTKEVLLKKDPSSPRTR